MSETQRKYESLLAWLRDGGSEIGPLEIRVDETGSRGIFSSKPINKDETLITISKSCIMTYEEAVKTKVGQELKEADLEIPEMVYLIPFLLQEKMNENSYWKPYIDLLPENHDNHPIFFSDSPYFEHTAIQKLLTNREGLFKKLYEMLIKNSPSFKYSYQEFLWGMLTVSTRVFTLNVDEKPMPSLIPLIDLLNHEQTKGLTYGYDETVNAFTSVAIDEYAENTELKHSYSEASGVSLFIQFGLIDALTPKSPGFTAAFYLPALHQDINKKSDKLDHCDNQSSFFDLALRYNGNFSNLLTYMRASLDAAEKLESGEKDKPFEFTLAFEIKVLNRLKQIFEETLEKFDTSDKDDIELLKTLNTNTQQGFQDSLAVTMRLREKQVLAHHIKFIDVALLQASYGTLDKPIFGLNKKMKLALKSYNKTILSKLFENEKTRAA